MEALIFILNGLAMLCLAVSSLLNDKRSPGKPLWGPFRYEEDIRVGAETGPVQAPRDEPPSKGWRSRAKNHA